MSGWIKWVSGGWPFIGLDKLNTAGYYVGEHWLIGQPGYLDNFGGTVTPVPLMAEGWHYYEKTFTMPEGAYQVRLKDEMFVGANPGGEPLGYFDDITLVETGLDATVDIDPDVLNLGARGKWVTCYIGLPEGYDVADIDASTVMLDGDLPAQMSDVQDGVLMVKFDRRALADRLTPGDVELTVTGDLDGGFWFLGTDTITAK